MYETDQRISRFPFLYSREEWQKDQADRFNIEELNQSLHESVPVLRYLDWSIQDISRGKAETVLPLNVASTNQFVTHQAALILLAADYTGGLALSTLFQKVPVIGIHSMETDLGAYIWGGKAKIKWHYPSCDDLVCRAEIPEGDWEKIARRFFNGNKVIITLPVRMFNGDKLVAEADFTYWAQDSYSMRTNAFDESRVNVLYDHKFKTSARLIAGLRALEQLKPASERLFEDPYAFMAAGNHGVTLAKRFCQYMPQLQSMVAARTKHIDDLLSGFDEDAAVQIVNIATGLDSRPWRVDRRNTSYFELDLPLMLKMRDELLPPVTESGARIHRIPIDLRIDEIDEILLSHPDFDKSLPTLVIWEGGSMYFNEDNSSRILSSVSRLLTHPQSCLWFDYVSLDVVNNTTGIPEIESFVRGMSRMSEPFINGYSDAINMLSTLGLKVTDIVGSDEHIKTNDPIYGHYRFCVSRSNIAWQDVQKNMNLFSHNKSGMRFNTYK